MDIFVSCKSSLLRHYRTEPEVSLVRSWKGHTMPVRVMSYDSTGTLCACGHTDGRVIIYDVAQGFATHNLRGHEQTVVSLVFHPEPRRLQLLSGSSDSTLRLWDLTTSKSRVLTGHMGAVGDICIINPNVAVSVGRDKVVVTWDLNTCTSLSTTAVFEEMAAVVPLPLLEEGSALRAELKSAGVKSNDAKDLVLIGGSTGVLRVFSVKHRKVVLERVDSLGLKFEVVQLLLDHYQRVIAVTKEQNLLFYDRETLVRRRQLIGDLDEVVDVCMFGESLSSLAVATNSPDIKVWRVNENDWELLGGHKDTVLSLDVSRSNSWLCSGGKDKTVRVWDLNAHPCVELCVLEGHTDTINCVTWGGDSFVVSAGKDRTVKAWKLQRDSKGAVSLAHVYTCIGHASEINCVDVSPNEMMIASGGTDKRITLWTVTKPLSAAPVLAKKLVGHKRGIWDVKFSPVEKRLASCSGDRSVRIWNVATGDCLRVLEGHMAAVLRVSWMTLGVQLVSAGGDGLLKIWNTHDGECNTTMEDETHDGKIWALDVRNDGEVMVTGSSDSILCVWRDCTKEVLVKQIREKQEETARKQDMENHVLAGRYVEALVLALQLDHRARAKDILEMIRKTSSDPRGALVALIKSQLDDASLDLLIKLCSEWNKNSTHCSTAHQVMEAVFLARSADSLTKSTMFKSSVESWLSFTQRHAQRISSLYVSSFVIDQCLELMGGGTGLANDETVSVPERVEKLKRAREYDDE